VIPGREEARLIYLAWSTRCPSPTTTGWWSTIGGGSTEFIIGHKLKTKEVESLYMGCVSYTARFFGDGRIEKKPFKQAELAAREQVQAIAARYEREGWKEAVGSSGTARSIAEVLQANGKADGRITAHGLDWLRDELLAAGDLKKLSPPGLARGPHAGGRGRRSHHVGRSSTSSASTR
jgi:exopolyphosphatase/guanosine-5'-triphosphate,3'-diphosphate pyrophosphatase